MPETWKTIPGFPDYEASDQGRVRSLKKGPPVLLRLKHDTRGYTQVNPRKDGRTFTRKVHHLVLEAFVGPCPDGYECDHLNTVRDDNRVENLRWVSHHENILNPVSRKNYTVGYIRRRTSRPVRCLETGEVFGTIAEASRKFGFYYGNVRSACKGEQKTVHGLHFSYVGVCHA